jgi:hypothetical protein
VNDTEGKIVIIADVQGLVKLSVTYQSNIISFSLIKVVFVCLVGC